MIFRKKAIQGPAFIDIEPQEENGETVYSAPERKKNGLFGRKAASSSSKVPKAAADKGLHVRALSTGLSRQADRYVMILPVLAVLAMIGAVREFSLLQSERAALNAAEFGPVSAVEIKQTPLKPAVLNEKANAVKSMFSGIAVDVVGDNVRVTAKRLEDWNAWRGAVGQLMIENPGVRFDVAEMCMGTGCGGEPLRVAFKLTDLGYEPSEAVMPKTDEMQQ